MKFTAQYAFAAHVKRCLVRQPCGTFVARYPIENDEVIEKVRNNNNNNNHPNHGDHLANQYIILSIRVDETVYGSSTKDFIWPHVEKTNQINADPLIEAYNKLQKTAPNGRFTPLKQELLLPTDNGKCFFDNRSLQEHDFNTALNAGRNNQGISKTIWQCERQNDIKVCIKRFNKDNRYFRNELSLLKDLSNFFVVTFYGQYSDNQYSYLVFEDAGESLESRCPMKFPSIPARMKFLSRVGFQVSHAMMYLEKKCIVHRDLTAGNVLINSYGFIRIADFGHAFKKEEGKNSLERSQTKAGENCFQFRFLAPECLPEPKVQQSSSNRLTTTTTSDFYARFSSKSDVWSFGILLIQLMIDDPHKPYSNIPDVNDIPKYVKIERKIHPQPNNCSLDMYLILKRCWAYQTIDRISFKELRDKMRSLEAILQ